MKKISLLFAFMAFFGAASFANTKEVKPMDKKIVKKETLVKASCTVTVSYGSTTTKITTSCDCTQKQACDAAYKLATILL
jgi:hypothetical protein